MRIATGKEEHTVAPSNAGAPQGKLGGKARAVGMTSERRVGVTKKAAIKRRENKTATKK